MKVELMPGIKSISGKNGNMLFKTFTKNGKKETRAYILPRIYDKSGHVLGYGHQRKTKPTDKELRQRRRFAFITRAIAALLCRRATSVAPSAERETITGPSPNDNPMKARDGHGLLPMTTQSNFVH